MISGVILAAGTASRFGSTKQLFELEGKPLVQHAIDAAAGAQLDEILVVLGHDAERVREALNLPENARAVLNPRFAEGQSTSLSAGLQALEPASEAAVVLLADQPGIKPEEIRSLAHRFMETRSAVVRLRYTNAPGPALVSKEIWPEALELTGDRGARALFDGRAVEEISIDREAPRDIDTPGDANESFSDY